MLNNLGFSPTWFNIVFMIMIPLSVGIVIFISVIVFISTTIKKHNDNISNTKNLNKTEVNKDKKE